MSGLRTLLQILVDRGGDELRMSAGGVPRLIRGGEPLRLFMPETSEEALLKLLGDLITEERWAASLGAEQTFPHEGGDLGPFTVSLLRPTEGAAEVKLRKGRFGGSSSASTSAPASASTSAPVVVPAASLPAASQLTPTVPLSSFVYSGPGPGSPALHALLERAELAGASDLHLADGETPVLRVDGVLRPLRDQAVTSMAALLEGLLTQEHIHAIQQQGGADLAIVGAQGQRCRLNVYRFSGGLACAVRLLRRAAPSLDSLDLPMPLGDLATLPHGLVLVVGPTGSGKSTTLAALCREIMRRRGGVLVTLEDPIEYPLAPESPMSLVRQRELGRDLPDFHAGLRSALREDPDVILVGEMRDPETISLALTAAETGHLVLSTLHSPSAASTVERVVDAFPAERQAQVRVQLADSLRAVVVQRLLPARSGGRQVAMELMRVTPAIANLIREGRTPQINNAIVAGRSEGNCPLERSLAELVVRGRISEEVARGAANDVGALAGLLR